MKRIQLFEFEDFDWLPNSVRTGLTNLLVVLLKMLGISEVLANLINTIKEKHNFSQIVDMGSGSGGAMPDVIKKINEGAEEMIKLLLTDLHPNPSLVEKMNTSGTPNVSYRAESFNACHINEAPQGLKTMINSFHHMPPPVAKSILKSAQDNNEPILIYELAENKVPLLIWWLLLPLSLLILIVMSMCMTPFVKGLTFKQLLLTYVMPIIPLIYAWDGQASSVRIYTKEDVESMLAEFKNDEYKWEIETAVNSKGKKTGYYILGLPR